MPRIRLTPLNSYPFSTEIIVRITDMNYGGHLGNDRMLALIHEARVAFLLQYGMSELDFGGASLTQADAAIMYLGQAFAGDMLRFEVATGEWSQSSFRFFYRVTRPVDGEKIALAETGMVCFDYQEKKIRPLPQNIKKIFNP